MKRGRGGGSLTGGTGDVNPQFMSFQAVQSAADTTTTTTQAIPVQRLTSGKSAQVMEVLKVFVETTELPASASATEAIDTITVALSTASFGTTAVGFNEPRVFAWFQKGSRQAFTAAGTYFAFSPIEPYVMDVTDGVGHGIIVAVDNIYAQVASSGTGVTNTANIKILFRWKNVGLTEYVGVVSSQQ